MRKELFKELLESVKQAAAIERGEETPSRVFEVPTLPGDVPGGAQLAHSVTLHGSAGIPAGKLPGNRG
jgi:hypothetical protein